MPTLILLRHGQSVWNKENRFTGWVDVGLSEQGLREATRAGEMLNARGIEIDICHTSYLKRAIKTLWLAMEAMDRMWLPVTRDWRLNERHYGALQGLNKAETAAKYGDEQVHKWRRSLKERPPAIDTSSEYFPGHDKRYRNIDPARLPLGENLLDTIERVMPCWDTVIAPQLKEGRHVLISAHGNSLRALIKELESISDDDINNLEIPTGVPILYDLDQSSLSIKSSERLE